MGGLKFISRRVANDPTLIRQARIKSAVIAALVFAAVIAFELCRKHGR